MSTALELDHPQPIAGTQRNGAHGEESAGLHIDANPEAIRAISDLINRLYDHGGLDLLRALISSGGEIANKLAEGADSPQALRAIRNGVSLLGMLASVEPARLQEISKAVVERSSPARGAGEPPSLWTLFKRFRSRESCRTLAVFVDMLESIGRALEGNASHK